MSLSHPKTPNFNFCTRLSQNVMKSNASGQKGKQLCCKCIFDQIKGNLAEIQPKNHKKFQESMG